MLRLTWWLALAIALAPRAGAAQGAVRLNMTAPRVLADGPMTVKGDDGQRRTLHASLVYEPATGAYVRTLTDRATGALVSQETLTAPMIRPSADEAAAAQALIASDPELAAQMAEAAHPVTVAGGFPLVREAGHACGPPARCVQYDLYQHVPGQRIAARLRYVVVDLRTLTLVSRDFDPAREGNLANPAIRAESRSR